MPKPAVEKPGAASAVLAPIPPKPPELGADERARLLDLVRLALVYATSRHDPEAGPRLERALREAEAIGQPAAVFVTLTEHQELRGCMGNLDRNLPLAESVVAAAVTVAGNDPRFLPVVAGELPAIHVEISVLGEPVPLPRPEAFEPGVDGVIVERSGRRALLLPEVATDQGWGAAEMFDTVCRKAGLPRDAWRDGGTHLLRFRTIRFGGPAT